MPALQQQARRHGESMTECAAPARWLMCGARFILLVGATAENCGLSKVGCRQGLNRLGLVVAMVQRSRHATRLLKRYLGPVARNAFPQLARPEIGVDACFVVVSQAGVSDASLGGRHLKIIVLAAESFEVFRGHQPTSSSASRSATILSDEGRGTAARLPYCGRQHAQPRNQSDRSLLSVRRFACVLSGAIAPSPAIQLRARSPGRAYGRSPGALRRCRHRTP